MPFGLNEDESNTLIALKMALASLEAKPIGAFHITEQQVDGTSDYVKDGEWPIYNGVIEVYAAPPAPVVPVITFEQAILESRRLTPAEAYEKAWNACRAATLQGKSEQPQNAQQNIPENIPGGNSPVTPDDWITAVNRLLDSDGSRGCYHAIELAEARAELERLIAETAPHQDN
ncbi:DUF551 domain-containing protein [Escherichia coli]|nr:DUF551 domain-containing protein [Escherichia coli]MEC4925697.1 DUF551 domain-containing protein [Escherichia coli]MEC4930982.1 DUF551 domain-containing protein [Escherichia coli]MEC4936737.1 DUF551 domain-containing protein [Escherichia coli]MEC4941496.1 DUF551 domain-containing protein [Escherichia coli]MEC4951916.1 DUF551 domain-containing protein [Escherichia coli]